MYFSILIVVPVALGGVFLAVVSMLLSAYGCDLQAGRKSTALAAVSGACAMLTAAGAGLVGGLALVFMLGGTGNYMSSVPGDWDVLHKTAINAWGSRDTAIEFLGWTLGPGILGAIAMLLWAQQPSAARPWLRRLVAGLSTALGVAPAVLMLGTIAYVPLRYPPTTWGADVYDPAPTYWDWGYVLEWLSEGGAPGQDRAHRICHVVLEHTTFLPQSDFVDAADWDLALASCGAYCDYERALDEWSWKGNKDSCEQAGF
ncbi:MAG: hypothetical protein ACI9VR_004763 [Cognaticolwellia sp.]|jgi:hypothetical protein